MESQLKQFFADLALDHDRLVAYLCDSGAAIQAANLSAEDEQALRTGNPHAIFARIKGLPFDPADPMASHAYAITQNTFLVMPSA